MARAINFGIGKGTGKIIKLRNASENPYLKALGYPNLPSAFPIVLSHDRRDYLEGNLFLVANKRYWIAAREPSEPKPENINIRLELRRDTSTRAQRRKA